MKEFNIYVSFVPEDEQQADKICSLLEAKAMLVTCYKRSHGTKNGIDSHRYVNTKALRASRMVLFLMTRNTCGRNGKIRSEVWNDYIEAVNYRGSIQKVFLFLTEPTDFDSSQMETVQRPFRYRHILRIDDSGDAVDYGQLLSLLANLGVFVDPDVKDPDLALNVDEQGYDVFISYKSQDEQHARVVYTILTSRGLNVFFSRASLPTLGSAEYHQQIDLAIERSRNMVVVTSAAKHVNSRWVEYEWRLFLGEKLAGRKQGNLVTVLAEGLSPSELPISLRHLEAIPLAPGDLERLVRYVARE